MPVTLSRVPVTLPSYTLSATPVIASAQTFAMSHSGATSP